MTKTVVVRAAWRAGDEINAAAVGARPPTKRSSFFDEWSRVYSMLRR